MKYLFVSMLLTVSYTALAQYPWQGYELYDWLVEANHPQGCDPDYVTFLPDDSTWVNMYDFSVMTGYFGQAWNDQPGEDLLLETSFHRDNYSVRLILDGSGFSDAVNVDLADWTQIANLQWQHMFPGCFPGTAFFEHFIYAMDFAWFGISATEVVIGIEITFLPTGGLPDFAGAYIIVPPCGNIMLQPDTTICPDATIDLDATTPGATYAWQDGSTNAVYQNATQGKYWVEITLPECVFVDTINIFESAIPLDLGEDLVLCPGETVILDAAIPGGSYEWQDNSSQPQYTVSEPGLYWVVVDHEDCLYADSVVIEYTDLPVLELGNDTTLCDGFTLALDATFPGGEYTWQDNSSDPVYLVTDPGTYSVTVTVDGCEIIDMIEVDFHLIEPVDLGEDEILCEGESLFLDAFTPGATYQWQDNSVNSGYNVTASGSYWVIVTHNGCSVSDEIEIGYGPAVSVDLGNDITACPGEVIILDATTPGAAYQWQDNSTAPMYSVTSPGTYSVTVEVDGCEANDIIQVTYVDNIQFDLGNDTTLCQGEMILLMVDIPGATYQWQDNSTMNTLQVNQPGTYWVDVAVGNCHAIDSINVGFLVLSTITLGQDTALCEDDTLLLSAQSPGASYVWQDHSNDTTLLVSQPGIYWVQVSLGNCALSDTIMVTYQSVLPVSLGNDTTLCPGETLLLQTLSPGAGIHWQDNSTGMTLLVDTPGLYWATATLGACQSTDTIEVSYISLAAVSLGNDTTLCAGENLLLDPDAPGAAFSWQDNSMSATYLVQQPGSYWVEVRVGNCAVTDTIEIAFLDVSAINLGNDTTLCNQVIMQLDATTTGASYLWQDNSVDPVYSASQPGEYWVVVTVDNCHVSDTIELAYDYLSPVDLGNDTTLCKDQVLQLDAFHAGATYVWQDGSMLSGFAVSEAGEYVVQATVGACNASDTIEIAFLELTSFSLGSDTTLCWGETLTLIANAPGALYVWSDNSHDQFLEVLQPGEYWVQASLANCSASDTIQVDFSDPVFIDLGPDTTLCPGEQLQLDATEVAAGYLWQDSATSAIYMVHEPGSYWVVVDVAGCKDTDTIHIAYTELPVIDLGNDTLLCEGTTLLLDATVTQGGYTWQDNSTSATHLAAQAGPYSVTVTIGNCTVGDTIEISSASSVSFDLGPDHTICHGESIVLDANIHSMAEYLWQDQSTTDEYVVTASGVYWLQVTDACGMRADTVSVFAENCDCHLYVPNVFSPDGDHINDELSAHADCPIAQFLLRVYDRAGGLMFESKDPGKGWDGKVDGRIAQVGVYAYIITYAFEGGKQKKLAGDVTIVR